MAPGQLGEIDPREANVVEIAIIEPMELVQRALVADLPACPEHELAEKAFVRVPRVAEKRRKVGKGEVQRFLSGSPRHDGDGAGGARRPGSNPAGKRNAYPAASRYGLYPAIAGVLLAAGVTMRRSASW